MEKNNNINEEDISKNVAMRPLKGHYGYLSDYSEMSPKKTRKKIQDMWALGIREFQFYDWFAGYSKPIAKDANNRALPCWPNAFFPDDKNKIIYLDTIKTYIEEIKKLGGCAWAYVQAVGADESNLADDTSNIYQLLKVNNNGKYYQYIHAGEIPTYFANAAWADRMVSIWLQDVKELGFTGIHWDTLGAQASDYNAEKAGIHEFLRRTYESLKKEGIEQTINFVDLAWWDDHIIKSYLAFPYVEVWSKRKKNQYYLKLNNLFAANFNWDKPLAAVIAYYPHNDESKYENREADDFFCNHYHEALLNHVSHLIFGNGDQRLKTCYFPKAVFATEYLKEKTKLSNDTFKLELHSNEAKWLQFQIKLHNNGKLSLKTWDKKHYLCAENGGGGEVHARYAELHN